MSFNVSYIFTAIDKFSEVSNKIGQKMQQLEQKVGHFNEQVKKTSENMKKVGESMSLYLGLPILEFGRESVMEFHKIYQSTKLFEIGFKNAGKTVGLSIGQIRKTVDDLFMNSPFDKPELLQGMTAQLLAFKHVTGSTFTRAQKDIADYATYYGRSLPAVTRLVGKALESPAKGLARMSRDGISFTKKQEDVLKFLATHNRLLEAQDIILKKVESRYRGTAAAMVSSPYEHFSKELQETKDKVGELLSEALTPFLIKINHLMESFNAATPATRKWIVELVGWVGIIGPIILAVSGLGFVLFGLSSTINVVAIVAIRTFTAAMWLFNAALAANPIVLITAAVAALAAGIYLLARAARRAVDSVGGFGHIFSSEFDKAIEKVKVLINLFEKIPFIGKVGSQISMGQAGKATQSGSKGSLFSMSTLGQSAFPNLSQAHAKIDVNIVDKGNMVKSVETTATGPSRINVGRNMAHVG